MVLTDGWLDDEAAPVPGLQTQKPGGKSSGPQANSVRNRARISNFDLRAQRRACLEWYPNLSPRAIALRLTAC